MGFFLRFVRNTDFLTCSRINTIAYNYYTLQGTATPMPFLKKPSIAVSANSIIRGNTVEIRKYGEKMKKKHSIFRYQ